MVSSTPARGSPGDRGQHHGRRPGRDARARGGDGGRAPRRTAARSVPLPSAARRDRYCRLLRAARHHRAVLLQQREQDRRTAVRGPVGPLLAPPPPPPPQQTLPPPPL